MPDIWSPLTTKWAVNLIDSRPRVGYPEVVDSTGHHHTASNSLLGSLQQFFPGGRTVTPNYFITPDDIYGIVPENRRAYTSASAQDDGRSITYEILNSSNGPSWSFDPKTIENVKRLDADLMRRYPRIKARYALPGFWQHRNLYEWFGRSYPTACAGPSFPMSDVISGAQALYDGAADGPAAPTQRRKNVSTMFWKNATNDRKAKPDLFVLAGDGEGEAAWLEISDPALANELAAIHGNAVFLSTGTWNVWKDKYLSKVHTV